MADPDRGRLGLFFGVLVSLAAGFVAFSLLADVRMVTLAALYMFTPMVAGLVVCLVRGVPLSTVGLRVGRARWLAVAALVALPLVAIALAVAVAVPGVAFDPSVDPLPGVALPSGPLGVAATFGIALALGATVNAVFAFGEEFGWRGYLLWELAPLGFWKASTVIGVVWGLWHAPIILDGYNYPSFPVVGVAAMTVACVAFSPLYTYLVLQAESVLAAALLHGVFNGSAGLVVAHAVGDGAALEELVASPVGVAGVVAFGLAAAGIAAVGAPSLTREFAGGERRTADEPPRPGGDPAE
ncbi:CPBP family intramembrane metalloprotease [Halostella sp. JP-L12]|uniref:CPBP family intramembrane glutamic endopeptidase n=1 Tax=Halostella TaxID=1843185 RepID=UPI000EF83FF5|nr:MULTISPECIES: CPBP family intramembrane glutamic endopeptidase [Halostella]NHN48303.1 CPBP family intramembrane metalloprotease [Halostella sp. JP-L12]